jgi:SAM-dependent methyltransferase
VNLVQRLHQRFYSDYVSESDRLHQVISDSLRPNSRILDLGCGGGLLFPHDYRAAGRYVVGTDLDDALWTNEVIDAGVVAVAEGLPFADSSFDLVYSRYVFEHLPDPASALREIARVLAPGGRCVILTPNTRHYVPLIARLTPTRFHKLFNSRLRRRAEADTFPTLYRANTPGGLRRLASRAGLEEVSVQLIETKPNYLMWSAPSFLLGVAYERLVNSFDLLQGFRVNILATFRKR